MILNRPPDAAWKLRLDRSPDEIPQVMRWKEVADFSFGESRHSVWHTVSHIQRSAQ